MWYILCSYVSTNNVNNISLQKLAASQLVSKEDFHGSFLKVLKETGIETDLRNTVYHWLRSHNNYKIINGVPKKEPLLYLRKAQVRLKY